MKFITLNLNYAAAVVALIAIAGPFPAGAADPQRPVAPPIAANAVPQKVAVLDGGDLISVEAHDATVAEVIEVMKTRLNLSFANTDRIDMTRVVNGTRVGNIQHILSWLVPSGGFVVYYQEQKTDKPSSPGRPERIGFLDGGPATAGAPSGSAQEAAKSGTASSQGTKAAAASDGAASVSSKANPSGGGDTTGKPDVADTGGIPQLLTVPEQLRAASVDAQLEIDRQQHDPTGQAPPPTFLNGSNNVAATTLEQQMQRSQALATSQLQALQQALRAACRGGPGSVC